MLTTSKRWAIVAGLVIVAAAIIVGASVFRAHQTSDRPIAALLAPSLAPSVTPPPATSATAVTHGPQTSRADATASLPDPAKAKSPASASDVPHFDVVRVEPTGEAVLAGQGAPNSSVDLMDSGKVVAQAPTDANGHFVMLPPPLKPGDYALSLRQPNVGATASESTQSVAISVPAKGKGQVVVAMAEPGRATTLLSPPSAMAELPPPSKDGRDSSAPRPSARTTPEAQPTKPSTVSTKEAGLAVQSVELENGNGFFASGAAKPGTELHVYLNDSHLADVVASSDGTWSVKIKKGLTGGHYVVRADAAAGTAVAARVEVPFDVPVAMAEASSLQAKQQAAMPPASQASAPLQSDAAKGSATPNAVIEEVSTAMVHSGDNLWDISRVRLGEGRRYTRIYAANVAQIRDPRLIYPGQIFVVPSQND